MADEPLLTIGDELRAPAEYQFETISGAIRLPTGGILVADRAALREYDEGGSYVQSWGRMGDGPGEFQFIGGLRKMGSDSVVVWDRWPRRLTVFDIDGNLGRTFTIPEAPQLFLLGVTGNRMFVFERIVTLHFDLNTALDNWDQREEYERLSGFVEVRSATGDPVTIIGPYPHAEHFTRRNRNRALRDIFYSRRMIAGIWGSQIIAGPNDSYELRAHNSTNGGLERIIRMKRLPIVPGDHHRSLLEDADPDVPMAATLPTFNRVLGDAAGYLWVRDYTLPGATTSWWTIFDPAGAIAARLDMNRMTVREIGRDYVVASRTGELGIEAVVVLHLDRG